ncbi:MAG TPA: FHA domain-containing protein [Ktedonobacterales bacterium]|nr:FHA domain-containing protein [Ktedonobacterales bacterium]
MTMQTCPHCGKQSRANDRFCLHCGQRLGDAGGDAAEPGYVSQTDPDDAWMVSRPGAPVEGPPGMAPGASLAVLGWLAVAPRDGESGVPAEYALDGHEVVIGRAPTCDIVLTDDQIASRRHSVLRYTGDRFAVADLGSSNGTYVNGVEIHGDVALADGDHITVGEHELIFATAPGAGGRAAAFRRSRAADYPAAQQPWPGDVDGHLATMQSTRVARPGAAFRRTAEPATPQPGDGLGHARASQGNLDALREQLAEASAALTERAEAAEGEAYQLRAALRALAQRAQATLAENAGADIAPPDAVMRVVRQAAENPRHLDHLSALAEHAGDVMRLLAGQDALAREMEALVAELADLAGEED